MVNRNASLLSLAFAATIGCGAPVDQADGPVASQAVSAVSGEPKPWSCEASDLKDGSCHVVISTPFAGNVAPLSMLRLHPTGSVYVPVALPPIVEAGRWSPAGPMGATARLATTDIRSRFRAACTLPDGSLVVPNCHVGMHYRPPGTNALMIVMVGGNPAAPDTEMPSIATWVQWAPGQTLYAADTYLVHRLWDTPNAQRVVRDGTDFNKIVANYLGAALVSAYPYWVRR